MIPAGATKLNLTNIKSYATLKSNAMVAILNSSTGYGLTDWVKNTEKEVTGFNSDGTTDAKRPQVLETGADCLTKQ